MVIGCLLSFPLPPLRGIYRAPALCSPLDPGQGMLTAHQSGPSPLRYIWRHGGKLGCPRSQVWEVAVLGLECWAWRTPRPVLRPLRVLTVPSFLLPKPQLGFQVLYFSQSSFSALPSCLETPGSYFSVSRTQILRRLSRGAGGLWGRPFLMVCPRAWGLEAILGCPRECPLGHSFRPRWRRGAGSSPC